MLFLLLSLGGSLTTQAITLDAILAKTLQKNPRILQAESELGAASGERLILRASALPKALIGAIAGDQGGQRAQESSNTPFIFAYGSFSQPLFHPEIPASYRRAEVGLLIAQQQLNVAVTQELHEARVTFYAALYNRALESLGRSQREQLEKNIAGEKARYEAGNTDRGAFTSAILLARELDPKIESAHRAYAGAVLQLAQSMGGSLGQNAALPEPEGRLSFQATRPLSQHDVDAALQRRADLKLARLMVCAARDDQRIVAAGYYPAVDAVASGEAIPVSGIHRDNHGSPEATDDTVASEVRGGVSYTWRVVDNGQVGGAVLNARSIREGNEIEL
ncbi:MAG TPA: TolC family protein, partial [Chthoniobacterales bacterium]